MWFRNWRDVAWLVQGTPTQKRAFVALSETAVLDVLAEFDPVLAGTIPLDIDIDGSDLDILCHVPDAMRFATVVMDGFAHYPSFKLFRENVRGEYVTVATFAAAGCEFELFGQDVPVDHQAGLVHLDVEARLLALGGEPARKLIRELKRSGLKTEPAFAKWLGLEVDPFDALYALGSKQDLQLEALVRRINGSDVR